MRKIKKSFLTVAYSAFIVIALAWSFISAFFFIFINKRWSPDSSSALFDISGNLNTVIYCVTILLSVIFLYGLINALIKKLRIKSNKIISAIYIAVSFLYFAINAAKIPFSPYHDAQELLFELEAMVSDMPLSGYQSTYLIFTATNKLTLYVYYPFARLIGDPALSVQLQNFVMLFAACVLISQSCGLLFGKNKHNLSMVICVVFAPYMLLVGPYIYIPSILLSSLILFLYLLKKVYSRIIAFLLCGVLFCLRPLALGSLLVFMVFDLLYLILIEKKSKQAICPAILLISCILLVKSAIGGAMYKSGLHAYPDMHNSAGLWTLDIGTRFDGEKTGLSVYTPYGDTPEDDIAKGFRELWEYYTRGDVKDYDLIKALQTEIRGLIIERSKLTILRDPQSLAQFIGYKYYNLFSDMYIPYYYTPHISSVDFSNEVSHNFHEKFFMNFNVLLMAFSLASIVILILLFRKRKQFSNLDIAVLSLIIGCIAVFLLIICFTEVMKKYTIDLYAPMVIIIVHAVTGVSENISYNNLKTPLTRILYVAVTIAAISLGNISYHKYDLNFFKNAQIVQGGEEIQIVFEKPVGDAGYSIVQNDGEVIDLEGKQEVKLSVQEDSILFYIHTPQGINYAVYK